MRKKKVIVGMLIMIVLIFAIITGIVGIKITKDKKISSSLNLGVSYLTEENYDKAKLEFSNVLKINNEHEEATNMLNLTETYMQIEKLYKNKEYILVSELITKIKENPYLVHIEEKLNKISLETDEKVSIINEINNMDSQVEQLIAENKYYEATDLINKYLGEDLKEDYLNKLNILMNTVNESKVSYEEEQARIAEEKRLEVERIAEEKRKAEEQQKIAEQQNANSTTSGQDDDLSAKMISKEIVKKILDFRIANCEITFENYDNPIVFEKNGIVYWAYKQIWQGESGTFLIIDMFTGKVIVSEKLDFIHGDADFYYPGY